MPPLACRVDVLTDDRAIAARQPVAIAVTLPNGARGGVYRVDWGDGQVDQATAHTYAEATAHPIRIEVTTQEGPSGASGRFRVQPHRVDHPGAIRPVFWDFPYPPPPQIAAPVAEFIWTPTNPTTDDAVTLDARPSTPFEHIVAYEWAQLMPPGGTSNLGPLLALGLMPAAQYVFSLRVQVSDGRWSSVRQRTFTVTAAAEPEAEPAARRPKASRSKG